MEGDDTAQTQEIRPGEQKEEIHGALPNGRTTLAVIPVNACEELDTVVQPTLGFGRLFIDIIAVVQRLIPQERHKCQRQSDNHKIDPECRAPRFEI